MSNSASAQATANKEIEQQAVNAIRVLSMDGVQKAKSGHPGLPMGCADFAFVLYSRFLKFDPKNPDWSDRDRFILSAGHGSMLIYSLLHLSGYDVPLEELSNFRQWESMTPGHPEYGDTPGVETTTGPLGAGFATGVGMALAEQLQAARYNTADQKIIDHYTYGLVSDGDLMEGVSQEAASVAGHLGLGKLIYFYDDNNITIEGDTSLAFTEDVGQRFEAYGWHVIRVDGHNREEIAKALQAGQEEKAKPTLIIGKTTIAFGSPNKAGTHGAHGAPLGDDEVQATRENLGWDLPPFEVPDEVYSVFQAAADQGIEARKQWESLFEAYKSANPELAQEWERIQAGELPQDLASKLPSWKAEDKAIATRAASGATINAIADTMPELIGGSADLSPSNNTDVKGADSVTPENFGGRNLHFGIREHAMGAMLNGMSLHGGMRPYGGTFLIFSDYCRPSVRLSALMKQPVVYVFTHDSIFLGEDGPTHQPVEHVASLRAMPNLNVIRPCDANETAAAWMLALERNDGPTVLALTRQGLPHREEGVYGKGVEKGGYVIRKEQGDNLDLILIASGSEVTTAIDAAEALSQEGKSVRVVSLPCWEIFESQSAEYRNEVLPSSCTKRIAVEAGSPFGWERYVGLEGKVVALNRFGASAPAGVLAEKFGFTSENVVKVAKELID